jgi:hypothetical protein
MDELTLIRDFGLSERAASPAERERARSGLLAHAAARDSRPRAGRRRWVVALVTVLLLLVTGTALALGPLHGLFEGAPAPPAIKHSIAGYNDFHEQLLQIGLGGFVVRSEDATGLIRYRVGKVRVRVWTAPLVDGGSCTFVETVGRRGLLIGPCTAPVTVQPPVLYGLADARAAGLLAGHVTDDVARLEVRLVSGRVRHLRLVKGFFATGFPLDTAFAARERREYDALIAHQQREARKSALPTPKLNAHQAAEWRALERRQAARRAAARPTTISAYDAVGRRIATVALPSALPDGITFAQADIYKGMRALLQINTPSGAPAILRLGDHGDRNCEATWFLGGGGVGDCGEHWESSSRFPGRWLLVGDAGEGAAAAEIRYGNGQRRALKLLEGRFLVELTDEQLAGVPELIVRDASARVIRTRALLPPTGP